MDIISMGVANKATMEESKARKQTLEVGVIGTQSSVAKRLEVLETSYLSGVQKANQLIVKDAINIMKAHQRLNTVALSKKYKMENMVYDDLLDLSGIDTTKSSNYSHDAILGTIRKNSGSEFMVLETVTESLTFDPKNVLVRATGMRLNRRDYVSYKCPAQSIKGSYSNINAITDMVFDTPSYYATSMTTDSEVEVDLLKVRSLDWVSVIFYYGDVRTYNNVVIKVSADRIAWKTVFNSAVDGNFVSTKDGKKVLLNGDYYRYIRVASKGNTVNSANHIVEILAFGEAEGADMSFKAKNNLAKNSTVTASVGSISNPNVVIDGIRDTGTYAMGVAGTEIQVDLNRVFTISGVRLIHYSADGRTYYDVKIRVSEDGVTWKTLLDNKITGNYVESPEGKLAISNDDKVRYIRCYANGSNKNPYNHWVEIEVYEGDSSIGEKISEVSLVNTKAFVSRDAGVTWQEVKLEQLTELDDKTSLKSQKFKARFVTETQEVIDGYSLLWS